MLICSHCGSVSSDFEKDGNRGFWCDDCDGYSYLDEREKHRFKLILEDQIEGMAINNKTNRKLLKRLSPLRYPGGKSKIINYLYNELKNDGHITKLVSPFSGGASFELSMLEAGIVEELHLNDLDFGVYAVFWTIKHMADELRWKLKNEMPTHDTFFHARDIIKNRYVGINIIEAAWLYLIVNRLAYSGIVKGNPLGGRNGSLDKLLARWNPDNIIKRIDKIETMNDRIEITNMKANELIEEEYWVEENLIFIDPPLL